MSCSKPESVQFFTNMSIQFHLSPEIIYENFPASIVCWRLKFLVDSVDVPHTVPILSKTHVQNDFIHILFDSSALFY